LDGNTSGTLITVGAGVTLTLQNITFKGIATNNAALIRVGPGGKLVLEGGAVITGNTNSIDNGIAYGGGVYVDAGGAFEMSGGTISGNTSIYRYSGGAAGGGGVYVTGGTFTMSSGTISGNTTGGLGSYGGGVHVGNGTVFTMTGGTISGNQTAISNQPLGGGVYVGNGTVFTMTDGTISDNYGNYGGGVGVDGIFKMNGGTVSYNKATYGGGGVCVGGNGIFEMTDGTISHNENKTARGTYGGGVAVVGDRYEDSFKATFKMSGGTISHNNVEGYESGGGGVYVRGGMVFTMTGGTISGNTVSDGNVGGGVYIQNAGTFNNGGTFTKTKGVIYGYIADSALSNWVGTRKADGTPDTHTAQRGDAVYGVNYRDSTLGENVPFSSSSGPWEN
jgi:hypothetical protein